MIVISDGVNTRSARQVNLGGGLALVEDDDGLPTISAGSLGTAYLPLSGGTITGGTNFHVTLAAAAVDIVNSASSGHGISIRIVNGANRAIGVLLPDNSGYGMGVYGSGDLFARTVSATVTTGTAPLTVSSTTMVANLNVQYLNGVAGSGYITIANGLPNNVALVGRNFANTANINLAYVSGGNYAMFGENAVGSYLVPYLTIFGTAAGSYSSVDSSIQRTTANGLMIQAVAGSVQDFYLRGPGGSTLMWVDHGATHVSFAVYPRALQGYGIQDGSSDWAYWLVALSAGDYVAGSQQYDTVIRSENHRILFTTSGGSAIDAAFTGGGRLYTAGSVNSDAQGRFKGWYNTSQDSSGPAAEIGQSGGTAYYYGYDRTTSQYIPVMVGGSTITLSPSSGMAYVSGSLQVSGTVAAAALSVGGYPMAAVRTGSYTAVPTDLTSGQIWFGY